MFALDPTPLSWNKEPRVHGLIHQSLFRALFRHSPSLVNWTSALASEAFRCDFHSSHSHSHKPWKSCCSVYLRSHKLQIGYSEIRTFVAFILIPKRWFARIESRIALRMWMLVGCAFTWSLTVQNLDQWCSCLLSFAVNFYWPCSRVKRSSYLWCYIN